MARLNLRSSVTAGDKAGLRKKRVSKGQIKLLRSYGHVALTDRKLQEMMLAHERFIKSADLTPSTAKSTFSLEEAERRVEHYLESLSA